MASNVSSGQEVFCKLDQYFGGLGQALSTRDGKRLAAVLSLNAVSKKLAYDISAMDNYGDLTVRALRHEKDRNLQALVTLHLADVALVYHKDFKAALDNQEDSFKLLETMYREGNTMVLYLIRKQAKQVRRLALRADRAERSIDPAMVKAVDILMAQFRTYGAAKGPMREASQGLALILVNELLSCYLAINNPRLCKPLTDWADKVATLDVNAGTFAQADAVTYHFFRGRLRLLETNYKEAERHFHYALQHCHVDAVHNRRTILSYYIPIKLHLNSLPRPSLLQRYQFVEYERLVPAFREGNFRLYQEELEKYRDEFIARGVYLMLEKLLLVVYRNFFKKIHVMKPETRVSLVLLHDVFVAMDPSSDVDLDEVECILINLIAKNMVRGYISHEKRMIVLSGANAFPLLGGGDAS